MRILGSGLLMVLMAWMGSEAWAQSAECQFAAEIKPFMARVLPKLAAANPAPYTFSAWDAPGLPTKEGFGIHSYGSIDPEKVIQRVMDVDHYTGNIAHVKVSRSISDSRYVRPKAVRFYELIELSILGNIHFEAYLMDGGMCKGYRVAYWHMLEPETNALPLSSGIRNDYNDGAWFASATTIGYALSSAPIHEDVNSLQWAALTSGADAAAKSVVEDNINGMYAWVVK